MNSLGGTWSVIDIDARNIIEGDYYGSLGGTWFVIDIDARNIIEGDY